ncbi:M48 family metallopeptidase [Stenotrophomonas sp. HITSZ_GD]|uniref:M48 family metallopeptidase n=1 Tax=Stenotrophomonas sp. HITSZ_GD TaxID=3037248 RepID=UPI00240E5D94|nr:M48 family metallopeptidase [Stenotrophomonas sp. HITSZ_GD]MDG2525271.1 M48 family metallopeptidase [Stenotrophomonas sp. HITSZ_GD]
MTDVVAHRALIERLEGEAARAPGRYRAKVALLALAGFAVLGGALVLALGVSVGLVVLLVAISPLLLLKLFKVVWIPIAFGWMLLRSLWVRFDAPWGYRLGKHEAPALQVEVERLRRETGAPRLHGIIIDRDLNAAAATVPRALGLFGHRHYLVLGLPLMQALDPQQFASVIAHEFGHFGGGHGRFGGWVYRVRASWDRVLAQLQARRSWTSALFVRFFRWYAPYFNAYSFVLARNQEYQADAMAARIAGARVAGDALVRVNLGSERLAQDFWPGMQRRGATEAAPPTRLYRDMADSLRQPHEDDARRLQRLLARPPGHDDTHPTLAQRLAALAVTPALVPPPTRSFAEAYLGDLLPRLEHEFSEQWRRQVEFDWRESHRQRAADVQRLAELEAMPVRGADEAVEHARLSEALVPGVEAMALYRKALEQAPADPFVHFRLGVLMLEADNAAGVAHLRRAISLDAQCREVALQHLARYYRERGDAAGEDEIATEWQQMQDARLRGYHARNELGAKDVFLAHGLDASTLAALRAVLDAQRSVAKAWLVRKQLPGDDGGVPHYVLLVAWRGLIYSEAERLKRLVDAIELPGTFIVFAGNRQYRAAARRLRKAAGEPVYRK